MSAISVPEQAPGADEGIQSTAVLLWERVLRARTDLEEERRVVRSASWTARAELLSALEAYAENLVQQRRPIPYALRDELRLRRRMK